MATHLFVRAVLVNAVRLLSEPSPPKIRATFARSLLGPRQSPRRYLAVMAREQNVGNVLVSPGSRSRELWVFQEALRKGLFFRGSAVSQDPWEQSSHSIDNRHSRDLPAGEDKVPEGDLLVDHGLDSGIDTFVVPTYNHQVSKACETPGIPLGEGASGRRGQDHMGAVPANAIDSASHDIGLEDHSRAASVRRIINGSVPIRRVIPHVVNSDFEEALLGRSTEDRGRQRPPNHLWVEGQNIESGHPSTRASGSRWTWPSSKSTEMFSCRAGTKNTPPSA